MTWESTDPIFINGQKIKTAVEDGTHIIDPEFQEEHDLGRWKSGIRIKIDIENKQLLKGLMKLNGEKWNFLHESPEQKFVKVIVALGELQSATGAWKGKPAINPTKIAGKQELIDFGLSAKEGFNSQLGGRSLLDPLEDVADFVGLVPEEDIAGKGVPKPKKKTQLQKKFAVFEQNPKIIEWRENVVGASYDAELARKLHTALYLFDMSPEDFLQGQYQTKELVEGKFTWVRAVGKASTTSEWISWIEKLVGYGKQNKKFKTWMNSEGTTLNLIEFANEINPDVYSGNNDMTSQGDKIRGKVSARFKGGGGREKHLKEAIKHFLVAHNKITGGKYPEGRWFYIGAPILQYADLHMEDKEIMAMYEELKKPELNFTEIKTTVWEDADKWLKGIKKRRNNPYYAQPKKLNKKTGKMVENVFYATQKAEYEERKKKEGQKKTEDFETSLEDWDDAFHYFLYAVEIGWRSNEAFTCGSSTDAEDFNAKKKSAIMFPKSSKPFMIVKFLTRKTWGISERRPDVDRYTATVDVFDVDVIDAVKKRQAQIKAGLDSGIESQSELYEKYGIRTKYDIKVQETNEKTGEKKMVTKSVSNKIHALIGKDGKYIQLGTMELQSSEDMTTLERKELEARGKRSLIMRTTDAPSRLRAIMRLCYERVMPEKHGMQKYWTSNSLHSLRHVFAQAWLARSEFDFKWVSERGHWGGIAILEQAYGKPTAKTQLIKTTKYSQRTLADAEEKAQAKVQDETVETSTGVTDPKVMEQVLALMKKMMNTKFETTKEYAEKFPEQTEGATTVEGVAEPEPESESEPKDEPEGVREA